MGEQRPGRESGDASDKRQKERLREEDRRNREIARPKGFHQSDFNATLKNGGSHGRGNGQRGAKERGQRDQQHESLDAGEYSPLILGNLTNLFRVGMRNDLLQLVRD